MGKSTNGNDIFPAPATTKDFDTQTSTAHPGIGKNRLTGEIAATDVVADKHTNH